MSPLFLTVALLSADPQPEKIESIVFLGTPAYAAKVRTFKFDYEGAKLRLFNDKGVNPFNWRHGSIVNDQYLFIHRGKFELDFDGWAVHGRTGEVRKAEFEKLSPWNAIGLGFRFREIREDGFYESEFTDRTLADNIAGLAFAAAMQEFWLEAATWSTIVQLKYAIENGAGFRRWIACDELVARGTDSIAAILELISAESRTTRLCGLYCLSRVDADIRAAMPQVIQSICQTAREETPISTLKFVDIANRCADEFKPRLQELAQAPTASTQERVYAIDLLSSMKGKQQIPFLFGIAADNKSEPIVARAAAIGLGRLSAKDELVKLLRTENKTARIWACYCLGTSTLQEEPIIAVLREIANEDDAEIREAATAAIASMTDRRP